MGGGSAGRGLLIVLEGSEGAGKSTQAARVSNHLKKLHVPHLLLREPGGTAAGEEIRKLLLSTNSDLAPTTECLLFLASRAELVNRTIKPALSDGKTVILDRFFLSTYAYQIWGRGLPEKEVREANALATSGVTPDLTLLLNIDREAGMQRVARRGAHDRMELSGSDFHERVSQAFSLFSSAEWQSKFPECGEVTSVDASKSEDEVFNAIIGILATRWPSRFTESQLHG